MSELSVSEDSISVYVDARGGTRRERGSTIAAYVRKHPGLEPMWIKYSETHGFQSATYTRYRKAV